MPGEGIAAISATKQTITRAGLKSSATVMLPPGTVLFSSRATIGKIGIAQVPLTTNQGFANLIPSRQITSRFLAYTLWFHRDQISQLAGSTTFKEVSRGQLRKFMISVPPLTEQECIVQILDAADELRRLRAAADRRTADLIPSLFYEMFGDPTRNPKGWPTGRLVDFVSSIRYGLGQPPETVDDGVPLLRATNIKRGSIASEGLARVRREDVPTSRNAFLKAADVLVVRSGAYTGDVAQVGVDWDGSVAGYDLVVSPGAKLTGEFVAWFLLSPFVQQDHFGGLKQRSAQPHLNSTQVSQTPFFCPPIEIQRQFAARVTEVRALETQQAACRHRLDDLFQSMLHRAFRGEL